MSESILALSDRDEALTPLGYALPQSGPVPELTKRILQLLRVDAGGVVIDLCSSHGLSSLQIRDEVERRSAVVEVSPLGERLARLVSASGVRTLQMSALAFGRFPMRYDKVLLRGGFASLRDEGRSLLSLLFARMDPMARFLVIDSAPSPDAPLCADGLRRWKRQRCPAEAVVRIIHEAGFATERAVVDCMRRVPTADCRAWMAQRGWPLLENFSDAEIDHGLRVLRRRYGAQPMVTFTSRFELVLGMKLETAGRT